jgi:Flp pilus assembly protein TadD
MSFRVLLSLVFGLGLAHCATTPPLPPQAARLNTQGVEALLANDLESADRRFAMATEYSPGFTEAWVNRGMVELKRGNFSRAGDFLERARSLNTNLPTPHHALGLLRESEGKFEQAESDYQEALSVDPGHAPSRLNLARLRFRRGAFEDAKRNFLELVELDDKNARAWEGAIECSLRLSQQDVATRMLEQARHATGDAPELRILLARESLRRGEFQVAEEALSPMTSVTVASSTRAAAWAWLAVSFELRGDRTRATQAVGQALKLEASQPIALHVRKSFLGSAHPLSP